MCVVVLWGPCCGISCGAGPASLPARKTAIVLVGAQIECRCLFLAVRIDPLQGDLSPLRPACSLLQVLAGVHVCQIAKDAGSSMDFMRSYAQLAVRLQPIMMKSNAFPTATRAAALLSTTSSMDDAQRQAIQELPRTSPAGTAEGSFFGSLHSEAGGEALFADAALTGHLTDAGLWGKSASRLSLSSVPEGTDAADRSNLHADRIARSSGDTRSYASTPAGGSPMAGSSPEAWQPLPPLSEGALGAVSHAGSGITAANGSAGVGS